MFQKDLLKDRAIFLTGGGSGLGRSMALRFAGLGAHIFVVGRREEPLKETCDEIHRLGGSAAYATCDVRDPAAVEAHCVSRNERPSSNEVFSGLPACNSGSYQRCHCA